LDMSGGWKQAKLAGRRPLDGRVRRLMEQSLLASHERQFATPHCAWHDCLPQRRHTAGTAPRGDPRCQQGAQARAEGWCRPRQASNAGGALAHGRRAEQVLRATLLETPAGRTSARARTAPKRNPGQAPALSATRRARSRSTVAQPLPTTAKRSHENLTGSPAASGQTARLSDGTGSDALWLAYADVRAA
jgi:hypothetical protein